MKAVYVQGYVCGGLWLFHGYICLFYQATIQILASAGRTMDAEDTIKIPQNMLCHENIMQALIDATYPGIEQGNHPDQYYVDRTILSCGNDSVDAINSLFLSCFPREEQIFNSADTVSFWKQELNNYQPYPTEYLKCLKASGLPLLRLALKAGFLIMLLRNLDPSMGFCNET
jgi:ATP-dependent DNA helicase PIF1